MKTLSKFTHWLFAGPPSQQHRDDRPHALQIWLCCIFFNALFAFSPSHIVFTVAILWPIVGILWFWKKLAIDAKKHDSDRLTEFLFAIKVIDHCGLVIFLWPLDMLITFCDWGPCSSFRGALEDDMFTESIARIAPMSGRDNAIFSSRDCFDRSVKKTKLTSQHVKELPDEITLNTKTAYACGATAVTLASTPAFAGESNVVKTTNAPSIQVTSYGWVTEVGKLPSDGPATNELRHARLRTIVSDPLHGLALFTEIDGAQLQQPKQDWFKQYFLIVKPSENVTLNVGRMTVSPIWMTPPPFLLETVNFPRLPWSVFAYAVEGDVRYGPWRVIADISGKSGLLFNDPNQFERVEGSMRVEYKASKDWTVSLTGQGSEDFARYAVDIVGHPASWIDVKGALYRAQNNQLGTPTTTQGGYGYVGIRPLAHVKGFEKLELHGQADYRETLGRPQNTPWILTGGARFVFGEGGRFSVTTDYQMVPGFKNVKNSGAFFLRGQVRF